MYSKIIKNGSIIDGTGKPAFAADLAIERDKIVQIGNLKDHKAQVIIDAAGKIVAPGFIDIQNHSDVYWTIFDNPTLDSLLIQGITTAIIGNCGASLAPLLSRDGLLSIQKWHDLQGVNFNWLSFAEFVAELSKRRFGVNLASLVGLATLRRGILKEQQRPLKAAEFAALSRALEQSLDAGAFGLSSGLSYAHESDTAESELLELAKILKRHNALFAIHLRSEAAEITESISEVLEIVSKTSVNMKISHLKVRNKSNWHLLPHILNLLEDHYQKKALVHFDIYPYDFVWQAMYTYLPKWAYEAGRAMMLRHLKEPLQRKKIKDYLATKDVRYDQLLVASTAMNFNVVGKTIGEIARRQGVDSKDALIDLIANGGSEVLVFERNLDSKQVEELLGHALSIVATDGAGFPLKPADRLVHPRSFGTMPKFLNLVLSKNIMPLEQAVRKITSVPAQKLDLKSRGIIAVDNFADLVIFDRQINAPADLHDPYRENSGVEYVFVNGEIVLERGVVNRVKAGKILTRK